jgi:hypothetical protein
LPALTACSKPVLPKNVKKNVAYAYSGVTLAMMAPGAFCATQGRGGGGRTISKLEKFANLTFAGRVARPNNLQIANGINEKTGSSRGGRLKPFAQADQWLGLRRGSKGVRPWVRPKPSNALKMVIRGRTQQVS